MEFEDVYVNNKKRKGIKVRGRIYIRKSYQIPHDITGAFERKCDFLGWDEFKVIEQLVAEFVRTSGWEEGQYKQAPAVETRVTEHIKQATNNTKRSMIPWFSEN